MQVSNFNRAVATMLCAGWPKCIPTGKNGFLDPRDLWSNLLSISPLSRTAKPRLWASSAVTLFSFKMHSSTSVPLAVPDEPDVTITTCLVLFSPGLSMAFRIDFINLGIESICASIMLLLAMVKSFSTRETWWACQHVWSPNCTTSTSGLGSFSLGFQGPSSLQR